VSSTIAVGINGSEPSQVALRWALDAAAARRAEVSAVIATPRPRRGTGGKVPAQGSATPGGELARARDQAGSLAGIDGVTVEELPGSPADVLLDLSGRVDLLVIGGHQQRRWHRALSTSITEHLATNTRTALCVARTILEPVRGRIVVGLGGTSSRQAVRFACAEARNRGWALQLVSTWRYPSDTRPTSPDPAVLLAESAAAAQRQAVIEIANEYPTVQVDTLVRLGHPVDVLAQLAIEADMVVVGLPGRHGFASMMMGSVAIGLLHRLESPVVIVPSDGNTGWGGG
jgi:nucleotide-binding universal stress UspA family protein